MNRDEVLSKDYERMKQLRNLNKGWFDFQVDNLQLPQQYLLVLRCQGLCLRNGKEMLISEHQVSVLLEADYPLKPPFLTWRTPIFHPNIRASSVCLLGAWSANTTLDQVCMWLWDMARYKLYNLNSKMDEAAGRWAERVERGEMKYHFPLDPRDLNPVYLESGENSQTDLDDLIRIEE